MKMNWNNFNILKYSLLCYKGKFIITDKKKIIYILYIYINEK